MAEEFFTARFGDDDETNVVDDYLKRRGWRETAPARRYLEALRDSTVSLYEVVDIDRGRSLTVRDLIRVTEPVIAHEKLGSENAALRDCLATRVVSVNGKYFFSGAMLRIPRAMSKELVAEFEKTAEGLAQDIRNELGRRGDGTPVKPSIVRDAVLRTPLSAPVIAQNWMVHSLTPCPGVRASGVSSGRSRGPAADLAPGFGSGSGRCGRDFTGGARSSLRDCERGDPWLSRRPLPPRPRRASSRAGRQDPARGGSDEAEPWAGRELAQGHRERRA